MQKTVFFLFLSTIFSIFSAKNYSIGEFEATINLGSGWTKKIIRKDMGKDQFFFKGKVYLIFLESRELLEGEEQYTAFLNEYLNGIIALTKNNVLKKQPFKVKNGISHASYYLKCSVSGAQISYQVHVLGQNGLNYLALSWSLLGENSTMENEIPLALSRLKWPGPKTKWEQLQTPVLKNILHSGYTFSMQYIPAVFFEAEAGDSILALQSFGGNVFLHCYIFEEVDNFDQIIANTLDVLKDSYPSIKKRDNKEIVLNDRKAWIQEYLSEDPEDLFRCLSYIVELKEGHFLEVRILSETLHQTRDKYLFGFLENMKIQEPQKLIAFSVPETTDEAPSYINDRLKCILKKSKVLGGFPRSNLSISNTSDGFIAVGNYGIEFLKHGETKSKNIFETDSWQSKYSAIFFEDAFYYKAAGYPCTMIKEEEKREIELNVDFFLGTYNKKLLFLRQIDPPHIPGLTERPKSQKALIIVRLSVGVEQILCRISTEVQHAVLSQDGLFLFVLSEPNSLESPIQSGLLITIFELKTGRSLGQLNWSNVRNIVATKDSWLFSGSPKNGPSGIYQLTSDLKLKLLISGDDCVGIDIDKERFLFASPLHLFKEKEKYGNSFVYETPLSVIENYGPSVDPFFGMALQRIAKEALQNSPEKITITGTKEELKAFFEKAQHLAKKYFGVCLPIESESYDQMISSLKGTKDLKNEGVFLLAVNLQQILLQNGAKWVDSKNVIALNENWFSPPETAFSIIFNIEKIVRSVLFEDSVWWKPCASIQEKASGRTILLGFNPDELQRVQKSLVFPNILQFLKSSTVQEVAALINRYPNNIYLRSRILKHFQNTRSIVDFRAFVSILEKIYVEDSELKKLSLALQCMEEPEGKLLDQLIVELKTEIFKNPREKTFYFLLARAYENSILKNKNRLALTCYNKLHKMYLSCEMKQQVEEAKTNLEKQILKETAK